MTIWRETSASSDLLSLPVSFDGQVNRPGCVIANILNHLLGTSHPLAIQRDNAITNLKANFSRRRIVRYIANYNRYSALVGDEVEGASGLSVLGTRSWFDS